MRKITRRKWFGKNIAIAAGCSTASALSSFTAPVAAIRTAHAPKKGGIRLAMVLHDDMLRMKASRQIGVDHAIIYMTETLSKINREQYLDAFKKIKRYYDDAGLTIAGVEGNPVPAANIVLGLPGRDEEIVNYCAALEAMGKVGIPMCCYNFMAGINWCRTRFDVPERGGALTSEFDYDDAQRQGLTEWGEISEDRMWDNITWFLERVIPAAEKANVKMALHPDDPPISPLRGIGRIIISAEAYRRVMKIVDSPVNGITFCQANFRAMGEDIEAVAKEFTKSGKNFFVHFRDIEGKGKNFHETFHDNGPTDMARMLKIYYENGFDGPIRPDHAPTLAGESEESRGYGLMGKVFAIGYMKGLMEAQKIPCA